MSRESEHTCHAKGCDIKVPPAMFMCRTHWRSLPSMYRYEILEHYVPGQELRMDPTSEYLEAARQAIDWLAEKEGK